MNGSGNLIKVLGEAIDEGRNIAFLTVISVGGSTPGGAGAKMLVYENGSIEGTIGGGNIEALAIKKAIECIKKGESGKFIFDLKAKGNTGMICEGEMEVFIDVYKIPFKILILGAGHVGVKIAEAAFISGYPYIVVDDRKEFANKERFPHASNIIVQKPDKAVRLAGADKNTYIVIVTRGHSLDKECLIEAMRTKAAYIGMIGSADKVKKTFKAVEKKKLYPLKDKRVYSPIGLNLGGKAPGEIAISVLSQIMAAHYKKDGKHMKIGKTERQEERSKR
ncbi:MAG: XdhC/CoxI family protein [Elusimicrobia bacterium]|nr:XdhC/CoxI family protein [Elusimicrobiota bacterium]